MTRFTSISLVLAATVCLMGARSTACSCVPPGTPAAEIEAADLVFAGEVESIRSAGSHVLEVRLRVIRGFKGAPSAGTITVRTASDGAACGYGFVTGSAYFVYAYESDGTPWVSLCSRTVELAGATEDLTEVDALDLLGYVPGSDEGCGGATNLGMIQAAAFSLSTLWFLRRRRPLGAVDAD